MTSTWLDFWNADHSVYVSKKHHEFHVAKIVRDIRALPESIPGAVFLDYGSGDANAAGMLADAGMMVLLFDPASSVTTRNQRLFQADPRIQVLSESDLERHAGAVDLLLVNSVLQYLSASDLPILLARLRDLLGPSGVLYIADVVSPRTGMLDDIRALLVSGWKGGFLFAALIGLIKTFFSDYRSLRQSLGFTTWDETALRAVLRDVGFEAERIYPNIGPTSHRMTFRAIKT